MTRTDSGRSSVTVRIAGEEHTIRANVEPDYTRRCAQLVDERIREIRSRSGLLETHKAAHVQLESAGKDVEERAARLTARIEEELRAHGSEG